MLKNDYRDQAAARESDTPPKQGRPECERLTGKPSRPGVDGGEGDAAREMRQSGAVQWDQGRAILDKLQEREEVREAALRPAADQPRAQGGLPCHRSGTKG